MKKLLFYAGLLLLALFLYKQFGFIFLPLFIPFGMFKFGNWKRKQDLHRNQ